jgi:HlyD family secretion protein
MTPGAKPNQSPALATLLETESGRLFSRRRLWLIGGLVLVAGLVVWLLARGPGAQADGPHFKTEPAAMGQLVVKVSATGTLQPTVKVEVGSELSGIVTEVLVEENDRVKKDQVLARLDLSKLTDAVTRSRAMFQGAEAAVLQAKATVAEARAALARYRQVAELSGGKVPSKAEMDGAEANLKRAEANEASARANVVQAKANLR